MVYLRKTWPSNFQRRFGLPIFYHQESFTKNETNDSQTVQDPGNMVEASKFLHEVQSICSGSESSKMGVTVQYQSLTRVVVWCQTWSFFLQPALLK